MTSTNLPSDPILVKSPPRNMIDHPASSQFAEGAHSDFILLTKTFGAVVPLTVRHLNLVDFKRNECPRKNAPHNHKSCYYYHSIKDKRRDDELYTPELCKFADTEKCPKRDRCRRAHNRVERLYHKDKYKTKFCHCYPSKMQQCEYGEYCSFAHSIDDIKVRLIHFLLPQNADFDFYIFYFKTEWCPYNHEHNKAQCVYAHNFQDFRRRPSLFRYETELCEDWQSGTFITCYEEGCKRLEKCPYSHGWKEQQFHPLVYKTLQCDEQKCFKGYECPFYHGPKDRRTIPNDEKERNKMFIPKERMFRSPQQPQLMDLYFENNLNHVKELELLKEKLNYPVTTNRAVKLVSEIIGKNQAPLQNIERKKELRSSKSFNKSLEEEVSTPNQQQVGVHSNDFILPLKSRDVLGSMVGSKEFVESGGDDGGSNDKNSEEAKIKFASSQHSSTQHNDEKTDRHPEASPHIPLHPQDFANLNLTQPLTRQQTENLNHTLLHLRSQLLAKQQESIPPYGGGTPQTQPYSGASPFSPFSLQQRGTTPHHHHLPPYNMHQNWHHFESNYTPRQVMYQSQWEQRSPIGMQPYRMMQPPQHMMSHEQQPPYGMMPPPPMDQHYASYNRPIPQQQPAFHKSMSMNQVPLFNPWNMPYQSHQQQPPPPMYAQQQQLQQSMPTQDVPQPRKLTFEKQTLQKVRTPIEQDEEGGEHASESHSSENYASAQDHPQIEPPIKQAPAQQDIRNEMLFKSCPQINKYQQQNSYKDKLRDLAESYKRMNLDFSDVQEDSQDEDHHAGEMSYNVAKSVLLNEGESESNETLERHLEQLHISQNAKQLSTSQKQVNVSFGYNSQNQQQQMVQHQQKSKTSSEIEDQEKWQRTQAIFRPIDASQNINNNNNQQQNNYYNNMEYVQTNSFQQQQQQQMFDNPIYAAAPHHHPYSNFQEGQDIRFRSQQAPLFQPRYF